MPRHHTVPSMIPSKNISSAEISNQIVRILSNSLQIYSSPKHRNCNSGCVLASACPSHLHNLSGANLRGKIGVWIEPNLLQLLWSLLALQQMLLEREQGQRSKINHPSPHRFSMPSRSSNQRSSPLEILGRNLERFLARNELKLDLRIIFICRRSKITNTDQRSVLERSKITFRKIKDQVPQSPQPTGVVARSGSPPGVSLRSFICGTWAGAVGSAEGVVPCPPPPGGAPPLL